MDEYRSPVTIIIDDHVPDNTIDPQVMAKAIACGLTDIVVKDDIGVIEGIVCTSMLSELSHIDGVEYEQWRRPTTAQMHLQLKT